MKKILVADDIKKDYFSGDRSLLARRDLQWFTAATLDVMLSLHRREKVNLIIIKAEMPGMSCEEFGSMVRKDPELRAVSLIVLCRNEEAMVQRASQCGANEVIPLPVDAAAVMKKVQQLLSISSRESYRVLLSINVEGNSNNKTFFCSSENISTSGMLIETDKELMVGDRVACSFFLPESKQIKTTGEVVRIIPQAPGAKGNRYGVKFAGIALESKNAIESFVTKKMQLSGKKA